MRATTIRNWALYLTSMVVAVGSMAADKSPDHQDKINGSNLAADGKVVRSAWPYAERPLVLTPGQTERRPVGSALSTNAGIGRGVSVDLTWDDAQYTTGHGRHIGHWWNGLYGDDAEVSVHFGYRDLIDSTASNRVYYSGYNMYDAANPALPWPRGVEIGCDLQALDPLGWGDIPSLDVMPDGRVVMAATSAFYRTMPGGGSLYDNMVFFQGSVFDCVYDPRVNLNITWVDSSVYRPNFLIRTDGTYSHMPQAVSQWDGTNTIVHVLLGENSAGQALSGDHYVDGQSYYTWQYWRKVGNTANAGLPWGNQKIIDSLWFPWVSLAAAPYPHAGVAVTYTNPSYYGALLDNEYDLDVWCRESFDRGITWQTAYSITNYTNPIANDPNHFAAWLETQALYSTDGVLHVVWTAKPTTADPYFDGFFWNSYDQDVYHWAKNNGQVVPGTGDIVRVARGSHEHWDDLCGDFENYHCGFGGSNAGYIANVNISECDQKLYCVWNQIHERGNHYNWRCASQEELQGVLDDCSYTGNRQAMANWDIFMSVSTLATSSLWDNPRNITNTYTPDCGLAGDPLAAGPCGSEYKPSVERYGMDEAGLSLSWPSAALVDVTPEWDPPYSGTWFLNMQYLDDQFPGPAYWGRTNPPATLNSIKWVRLVCVEPIYEPVISIRPLQIAWPNWVQLGTTKNFTVTVINDGNVTLNVTGIGFDDNGGGWLGASATSLTVPAGVDNKRSFNVIVNAGTLNTTQWLDGELWLRSDAVNNDSVSIPIHILVANDVEPVAWDTVTSHQYMFDPYFYPEGECVALAVSNFGEIGWGVGTSGGVNLDYRESEKECGTREADAIYLKSGSPFVILADNSAGANARLTCSYKDFNQADPNGWDPTTDKGSITGGLTSSGRYDSVYTGKFVNRDTTIAMERIFYAPRSSTPASDIINFVICVTKFYSADGLPHNHLTVGNAIDWNIPSDNAMINTSGVSQSGFVYMQGTDTSGHDGCQLNANRYATEAFGGGYTSAEYQGDPCVNDPNAFYSFNASDRLIMVDTNLSRNGSSPSPLQPDPTAWWEETGLMGLNNDATRQDQCIFLTHKYDYNLGASDTLYFWTVLSTVRNGTLSDLESQVAYAKNWFMSSVSRCCASCCVGRVGDANLSGEDEPTIGDVSVMIDAKFITGRCDGILNCLAEADVNQSGGPAPTCDDITIGDISILIDHLFITGPSLGLLNCGC